MLLNDKTFVAEAEDRRGETFPEISIRFAHAGQMSQIGIEPVERSAYLRKVGEMPRGGRRCIYVPARRPWNDRFNRSEGYPRDSYENDYERNSQSNQYYVDSQFGNMLFEVERKKESKQHFLSVLRYIEPTIIDFWIDRAHGQDYLAFESASGFSHRVGIVGEGVLNIFRLCYSIIYQRENEILLVDEPELSLHPQSQRRLYRLLAQRALDRQVIASTHSVHFVDWKHINSGTKIYRANLSSKIGSTFHSLTASTIKAITAIVEKDIKNRRAFDALAKEVFFSRGCVFVEGYEDAHLLQKYLEDESCPAIEIFGYGSGGADGIIAWLSACHDLEIPAIGLFDSDRKGLSAIERARSQFAGSPRIKLLQIPTPDIRDKHKFGPDCRTETAEIETEGLFTKEWVLKPQFAGAMRCLIAEMADFLKAESEIPSLTSPAPTP